MEYRPIPDDTYPLMHSEISSVYTYAAEVPSQNPREREFENSGVFETMIDGISAQYRYEPVKDAIPLRVKRRSVYEPINHHRGEFRRLTSVSMTDIETGVQRELMAELLPDHHIFIKTAPHKESSYFIPWENATVFDCSLDSPLAPLYLLQSVAHAIKRQEHPDWYAVHTNPMDMALATTVEFGGNKLYLQRMAWQFALEHLDPFMKNNPGAVYDRQRMSELMEADLKRCRAVINDERAHPFKTTLKRVGEAALLGVAQSDTSLDTKPTPQEEDRMKRLFGYEVY